ncbi:MAG: pyridoxine 5'-phosphate synthase [Planctomycetes bacterium]|nr:pyridoxine 5'-phosphate synthase [Planctomycetota bacterium]
MIQLGVNIDHVATVRQARRAPEPDPVHAAQLCELAGADGITVHLRLDRRHIQDRDVRLLRQTLATRLNLEMGVTDEILAIADEVRPHEACLVPEGRQELTTEGGLAVREDDQRLRACIDRLRGHGTLVSLFIEPDPATVRLAQRIGAGAVELHTGTWANAWLAAGGDESDAAVRAQLRRIEAAADTAAEVGIRLHAGHGITYRNVRTLLHLPLLRALNIGHSIVSRAVLVGMERAVGDMKRLIEAGPG